MAAFGISFPKFLLSRPTAPKVDTNTVPTISTTSTTTTTATITPKINTRTLSLSIKSVPSQPLHYDVSSTTIKKTAIPITTILAIDGETKQLPKNLSVFNGFRLDDGIEDRLEKRKHEEHSTNIIIPSSIPPMGTIDHRSDIRLHRDKDLNKMLYDPKNEEKASLEEHRSNHTFTSPTSSLSQNSSSCDLHLIPSSISVDIPQLKYAIEKFLVDDDNPIYHLAEEFSSGISFSHQDQNLNAHSSNTTKPDLKDQQPNKIADIEFHSTTERDIDDDEKLAESSLISNSTKWYVSELRIHRPMIYPTQWSDRQQYNSDRRLSRSVSNLNQIYHILNRQQNNKIRRTNDVNYSTLSLQHLNNLRPEQYRQQSDDNILFNNQLSSTDDDLRHVQSDEDPPQLSPLCVRKLVNRHLSKDDLLIRNESVKKKLFDILNDDELENACLEDMSQEFEQMSLAHPFQVFNSFSSSSDDALYVSPPTEFSYPYSSSPPLLPPPPLPFLLSSSYDDNLSVHSPTTTERSLGRSRLITTSLDKIPMNNNTSTYLLPSSCEQARPSWHTSPSPQWRVDDQLPTASILKRYSSMNVDRLNELDTNRLISTAKMQFNAKENQYIPKYNHEGEQRHVSYSLMNPSTPLVENSSTILPIIQKKSSNLIMFI